MVHNIYVYSAYDVSLNSSINTTVSFVSEHAVTEVAEVISRVLPEVVTHPTTFNFQRTAMTIKPIMEENYKKDNLFYTLDIDRDSCTFFKVNLWVNAIVLKVKNYFRIWMKRGAVFSHIY